MALKIVKRIPSINNPAWTGNFRDDPVQILLARMIYGEARDARLSDLSRIAVAYVARNRLIKGGFGKTYHDVILKKFQFSCFNQNDPNRKVLEDPLRDNGRDRIAWLRCYALAAKVIKGAVPDPTHGALYYHSGPTPRYLKKHRFLVQIDSLRYYL
ncbi:cell wall hydrolase [Candidatus Uhrbacteria bacterium]|nr:cell wall hydrolase [Candidatus Uhrbacteria bacterium]